MLLKRNMSAPSLDEKDISAIAGADRKEGCSNKDSERESQKT